jgi:hypothetical protein
MNKGLGIDESRVYALQRSEVLDEETCDQCKALDGKVFRPSDPRVKNPEQPELHSGCRGIWVEIMDDEVNPPPFSA